MNLTHNEDSSVDVWCRWHDDHYVMEFEFSNDGVPNQSFYTKLTREEVAILATYLVQVLNPFQE